MRNAGVYREKQRLVLQTARHFRAGLIDDCRPCRCRAVGHFAVPPLQPSTRPAYGSGVRLVGQYVRIEGISPDTFSHGHRPHLPRLRPSVTAVDSLALGRTRLQEVGEQSDSLQLARYLYVDRD